MKNRIICYFELIFGFLEPYVRCKLTVYDVLKRAKYKVMHKRQPDGSCYGLCEILFDILYKYPRYKRLYQNSLVTLKGKCVSFVIPEFNSPFADRTYRCFWWSAFDLESRVKYLDELMEIYKDDKTNILSDEFLDKVRERIKRYEKYRSIY